MDRRKPVQAQRRQRQLRRARFNLASSDADTGRASEAGARSESLVRNVQFMWGFPGVDYRNRGARLIRCNIANESAVRLSALQRQT